MNRFYRFNNNEKGQGLVEYALILVLVAIVVIAILLNLGPAVGRVFSRINNVLQLTGGTGVITSVSAERKGGGSSNDIEVTITVSTNTSVTIDDSQNGDSETVMCNGSCTVEIDSVGEFAGTVTVTAVEGGVATAGYSAKSS